MIPYIYEETTAPAPVKTFRLDFDKFELKNSVVDGEEALHQAIQVICAVRRNTPGFPEGFGLDLDSVLGVSKEFTKANLERLIRDALDFDDRIASVDGFEITGHGEHSLLAEFTVHMADGGAFEEEVIVNAL